jgi:hypothetical protein
MSSHRFQFLLSHLRMDDRAERDENNQRDKFAAARGVFELFNQVLFNFLFQYSRQCS